MAVVHGVLVQRFMVKPFEEFALADKKIAGSTRRLVPLLLHFSTISWFLGGLALVAAANWFGPDARLTICLFVGGTYMFGAIINQLLQRIEIPYEAGHLHGLRLGAVTASRGTILIHAGFDAYVEEFYAFAQAIALCGYEVVMFDGPGQGSTLMREKIPMTHEWEKPVGAVLDHLALTDVTLIGISLGGYLAMRAAAFEPRIKRVVAFDVMLDFFQCVTSRRGVIAEFAINALVRLRLGTPLNMMARGLMKWDHYSRWGIQQGMHVTGAASPSEYFFKLRAYNSHEVSQRVTQDTLIMAGVEDHFVPLKQFFDQLPLLINARSVTAQIFTQADQAQSHCQVGNQGLALTQIVSWVETHS